MHWQKCQASPGHKPGDFPVAEKAARECLSRPIFPELTDPQIQRVVTVTKDFFKKKTANRPLPHFVQMTGYSPLRSWERWRW
ncbi:MAG: DegT/DnrJ/EryC1/StrS family aminotransferase [Verrucomicrobiota bacterium]